MHTANIVEKWPLSPGCSERQTNKYPQIYFEAQPKSATQKRLEIFPKIFRVYERSVPLLLMFLPINHITVLPHNHLLGINFLSQKKDPLHMIMERHIITLLNFVQHLSPHTIVTLLFADHVIQNITRVLPLLHNKTTNKFRNSPRSPTQLPAINQNVHNLELVFQAAFSDNLMKDNKILEKCIYFDVGIVETTNVMNGTEPNTNWYIPLNIPLKKSK